jgi:hypothetical protein
VLPVQPDRQAPALGRGLGVLGDLGRRGAQHQTIPAQATVIANKTHPLALSISTSPLFGNQTHRPYRSFTV